jgi:signal transduction histidine kinase
MIDHIMAVDLGGTQVRAALCDAAGKILDRVAQPANAGEGIEAVFARTVDCIRQVARQGSSEKEGTGLGLAIAKKSVELLGGRITAESEVSRGTTFTIRIEDYDKETG